MRTSFASGAGPSHATPLWRRGWALRAVEIVLLLAGLGATQVISKYVWQTHYSDVVIYYHYAQAFWLGRPPFHTLPVEYPPLAILPFSLTLLPPLADFYAVYAYWMEAFILLGYAVFARFATRRGGIAFVGYLLLGAATTVLARFDLLPALLTLGALWLVERRRFTPAYVLLAAGILLKLYPGFLLPIVAIAHWRALSGLEGEGAAIQGTGASIAHHDARDAVRAVLPRVAGGVGLCLGIVGAGFLVAALLSPAGALSALTYAGDRPLQVESTPATLLWLGTFVGLPARHVYSFGSSNYVGPLDAVLKPLSALALVAGCLWVYWRQARGRLPIGQAFVACLGVVLVTNKIFSPQYLIWALPVVAAVEGFDAIWVAICLLTTLDYPFIYHARHLTWQATYDWQYLLVIALRNVLVLYATLRALLRVRPTAPHAATATEHSAPVPVAATLRVASGDA